MALASKKKIFDGKYEIVSIVGRGSRSVVYYARNIVDDNTEVALKVLTDNKKDKTPNQERLRHEALAMVSSYHQYVVRLDDFHSIDSLCYLAMEYAPEGDLRKYTHRQEKPLSPEQAELFFIQAAEALDYIHKVGIIHRDIKPDNILVVDSKSIRIADFGVALLPGDTTAPYDLRNAVGTMDYMAPEVLEGIDYNQRSDIYALGVTFYEMVTGAHPFSSAPLIKQLEAREDKAIKPIGSVVAGLPPYLAEAIMRCMAYDQKVRFTNARELLQHLKGKKTRAELDAAPAGPQTDTPKKSENLLDPFGGFVEESEEPQSESEKNPEQPVEQSTETKNEDSQIIIEKISDHPQGLPEEVSQGTTQTADPAQAPFRDSRASRTPTLHMNKEDAESFRRSTDAALLEESYESSRIRSLGLFLGVILITALVVILGWSLFQTTTKESKTSLDEITSSIPSYVGDELRFPNLPKGVFVGSASGIIPGKSTTLTIISFPEREEIAIILGIPGWIPTIISVNDESPSAIRISSNGLIFTMDGTPVGNTIEGTVENLVDGTSGKFALIPIK